MSTEEIELLQGMAVFGAVSDAALEVILTGSSKVRLGIGETFIREGDEAQAFYVLEEGRVRVQRGHQGENIQLAELGAGDCFGEMAIIECAKRSATVVALEACRALRVPFTVLQAVMEHDLEQFVLVQMNLARELSRRLREADRRLFESSIADDQLATESYGFVL